MKTIRFDPAIDSINRELTPFVSVSKMHSSSSERFRFELEGVREREREREFGILSLPPSVIISWINSSPCLNSFAVKLSDTGRNSFHPDKSLESLFLCWIHNDILLGLPPSVYRLLISLRFNEDKSFAKFESHYREEFVREWKSYFQYFQYRYTVTF